MLFFTKKNRLFQIDMSTYPTDDVLLKIVKKGAEAESAVGLPLGVQVIGKPYQDEIVLHAMKQLESAVNFDSKYTF